VPHSCQPALTLSSSSRVPTSQARAVAAFASLALSLAVSAGAMAQAQTAPAAPTAPVAVATNDTGWQVLCRPQDASRTKLACNVFQEIVVARDRTRVLAVEIARPDKVLVLTALTPVNVNLKDGVSLTVTGDKLVAPFVNCQANGCVARFEIVAKTLDRLKTAKSAVFEFTDIQGSKVRSELSMTGFVIAMNKLD
jgi:invasion protein IalB